MQRQTLVQPHGRGSTGTTTVDTKRWSERTRLRPLKRLLLLVALPLLMLPGCETDAGCKDDFDCESALVCRVASGKCELFVCDTDAQCSDGRRCADNVCEEQ